MKYRPLILSLLGAASLFSAAPAAQACSCIAPDVARSFTNATDVASVRIKARKARGGTLWYAAEVTRVAKGCLEKTETILLKTQKSSAACGLTNLKPGTSYLINGDSAGQLRNTDVLSVSLCDYNVQVSELTRYDVGYLRKNAEDCDTLTCDDLAGEDFGMCAMVLGYGVVNGTCQAVSGCSLPDDVELADSIEECEETCDP